MALRDPQLLVQGTSVRHILYLLMMKHPFHVGEEYSASMWARLSSAEAMKEYLSTQQRTDATVQDVVMVIVALVAESGRTDRDGLEQLKLVMTAEAYEALMSGMTPAQRNKMTLEMVATQASHITINPFPAVHNARSVKKQPAVAAATQGLSEETQSRGAVGQEQPTTSPSTLHGRSRPG